jgi:hypothetical protein
MEELLIRRRKRIAERTAASGVASIATKKVGSESKTELVLSKSGQLNKCKPEQKVYMLWLQLKPC